MFRHNDIVRNLHDLVHTHAKQDKFLLRNIIQRIMIEEGEVEHLAVARKSN